MSSKVEMKKVGNYYIYTESQYILGAGTQATVHLAKRCTDDMVVAAKIFDLTQNFSEKESESIKRQLDILFTTKHPYILDCYDFIQTKNNIYLFIEFCSGGDLQQYIESRPYISEAECLDIFKQIVSALQVLDKSNIAHRDLKPANILLNKGQVKIADFGFAKRIQSGNQLKNTYVGSPIFMSPQALMGGHYDLKKGDVWSAGVCLYFMLFKKYPFESMREDIEELKQVVIETPLKFPDKKKRSNQVKELLQSMLDKDENKRFSLNQVAAHECLNYNSQGNVNPLLRSSELNQVSGISSYNSNLKDFALYIQDKQPVTQNSQIMNQNNTISESNIKQTSEQFLNKKEIQKNMISIHNLLIFFSIFPQKKQDIWRSIKSFYVNKQLDQLGENPKKSLILLMSTNFIQSKNQIKNLIDNNKDMIIAQVKRINEKVSLLLEDYFSQENYKSFIQNLLKQQQINVQSQQQQMLELSQILKDIGFTQDINDIDKDVDEFIGLAFYNLSDDILVICKKAVQDNNKLILNLFSYLLVLRFYEEKIKKNNFNFTTYDELMEKLESFNFAKPDELYNQIEQYQQYFKKQEEEEEDDEDGDD